MMNRARSLARKALRKVRGRNAPAKPTAPSMPAPVDIDPREKLLEFWRQPEPEGNKPASFITPVARSAGLFAMLNRVIPKESAIIELGCGVGRNLAFLWDRGFTNLEGVEINPHAIKLLRETYPQLKDITIHEGSAEDVLPNLADDQFDAAITMATLQHIHPDSSEVFDHLVRIAVQVFIVEGPPRSTNRQHPHNYDEIFTSRGMSKLSARSMAEFPGVGPAFGMYTGTRYRRMDTQSSLHSFWRQSMPPGNNPNDYIHATNRSEALLEIISDLPKDSRILEVGCNVGRNIAFLHDNGYAGVEGVEINPHAVQLLRKTYPQLADTDVHIGPAGEVLPKFEDDSFDLVFTMAVLEHIHPDESTVFDNMARIGSQVLAIEPEGRLSHRQFPHDIPRVFTARGLTMVSNKSMADFPSNAHDKTIHAYNAYRFHRPEGWTPEAVKADRQG